MAKVRAAPTVNYKEPSPRASGIAGPLRPLDQINVGCPAPGPNNISTPFIASGSVATAVDGNVVNLALEVPGQPTISTTAPVLGDLTWQCNFTDLGFVLPAPNTQMVLVISATVTNADTGTVTNYAIVISFSYVPPAGLVLDTVAGMSNQSEVTITGTATNATSVLVNVEGGSTDITGKFYYTNDFPDGSYALPFTASNSLPAATPVPQYAVFSVDTTPPSVTSASQDTANNAIIGVVTDAISGVNTMTATIDGINQPDKPPEFTVYPVVLTPLAPLTHVHLPITGPGPTPVPVPVTSGGPMDFKLDLSQVTPPLATGQHFAFFVAVDKAGNAMTTPYFFPFTVS